MTKPTEQEIYNNKWRRAFRIKPMVKKVCDFIGIDAYARSFIRKYIAQVKHILGLEKVIVHNVNKTSYDKKCLLIYMTGPFTARVIRDYHQNVWQNFEMARVIGTFGYNVDAVNYSPSSVLSKITGKYDLIVGLIPRDIDFWTGHMNEGCLRVSYLLGMNSAVTQGNERKRLHELEQRRGFKLQPRLSGPLTAKDIEDFDAAWFIGNSYNLHSFDSFKMPPVSFIKNNGYDFQWLDTNIIRDKRNFIFFASRGQVHKGLDLLLDIFGQKDFPYNLYICSSFVIEKDFCEAYHEELHNRPNIFAIGYIDINGSKFRELTEKCAYCLMPSCAEARAGSILTMMSAGVIPIVSRECGYDDDEVINMPDCSIETIERYIHEYAAKPDEWIKTRSAYSVDIVRTRYSKKNFTESVQNAMSALLEGTKSKK